MLPPTVADNLKQNKTTSEMFDSATICFTEIADFKAWLHCIRIFFQDIFSQKASPSLTVAEQK